MRSKPKKASVLVDGSGPLYAAKLLFQWRVIAGTKRYARRLCEERVILLRASSAESALTEAKRYGATACFTDHREKRQVFFEFVGVVDLDDMLTDLNEHPAEVWYELRERLRPMERRRHLLVPEKRMRAFAIPRRGRGQIRI